MADPKETFTCVRQLGVILPERLPYLLEAVGRLQRETPVLEIGEPLVGTDATTIATLAAMSCEHELHLDAALASYGTEPELSAAEKYADALEHSQRVLEEGLMFVPITHIGDTVDFMVNVQDLTRQLYEQAAAPNPGNWDIHNSGTEDLL